MKVDILKPVRKIKNDYIKNIVNKRQSQVSDIKLKDLILNSNKVEL